MIWKVGYVINCYHIMIPNLYMAHVPTISFLSRRYQLFRDVAMLVSQF